ncbi:MAG: hypothetical protein A2854_02260 [Parcubacteria group bacterium RIFCSPHIGHO2_01_FULL_56_18]|nr:MAG: hypothetical protein A2854_02260 [Parcubacteria group bacterium RIFCSPHIGHO2_01_FULL_56_18]
MKKKSSPKPAARKKTEIRELSEFIRDHMVTKNDLKEHLAPIIKTLEHHTKELADIKAEIRDIRQRLEVLERRFENLLGVTKEIDHLLQRVVAIEKRLGLKSRG